MGALDENTRVLEIGALHRPSLPKNKYNVKYADFTDTETLKFLYRDSGYDLNSFQEVDYIIEDGDYKSSVGDDRFELILASHVGEHMPDFIGWLHEMYGILDEGGVLSLILPDKRFTFDIVRPPTTAADWLTAYTAKLKKPSYQQIYDTVRYHTPLGGADLRKIGPEALILTRAHTESETWNIVRDAYINGKYFDSHCSILTPKTFFENICRLEDLNLFPFEIDAFYDAYPGDIDFQVRLRKPRTCERSPARDFHVVIDETLLYSYNIDGETVTVERT
ncbi:class I SAM-dependent methyltransferase [Lichenihabitans sp. PAMC28606]|uniref:class I SAM-dependent methyltransferase n=1 Tax=Lichenihabitans sp. PAMC28606 TaxID=2880932 RepID=UPI001D0B4A13|nr:class I SAM-dependent methyltransferase [Lichenihabitans sp. PAMC28606]UDL93225.1 class I SAM-dependent methyltransferase [Lichenihabitans sp. PAMC28606]